MVPGFAKLHFSARAGQTPGAVRRTTLAEQRVALPMTLIKDTEFISFTKKGIMRWARKKDSNAGLDGPRSLHA